MKSLYKEFKEFAVKGNMIDIAIGVIIGAACNKVISVMVSELFMPPLKLLTNGINFSQAQFVLRDAVYDIDGSLLSPAVAIGYGAVLDAFVDFVVIAITIFIVVKAMNRLRNRAHDVEDEKVTTPKDIELLDRIATLLDKQNQLLQDQKK